MKKHGRAILILLSLLIVCATGCGGGSSVVSTPTPAPTPTPQLEITPPSAGYLPEGWRISLEIGYGEQTNIDIYGDYSEDPSMGIMKLDNEDASASISIEYRDLPEWAVGQNYSDPTFLTEPLNRDCESCKKQAPYETGTMTFCGRTAAYVKFSIPAEDYYGISVIALNDSIMITANAVWNTEIKGNEVTAILGNISFF